MKINNNQLSSISENDAFVSLIIAATEDREMKETIKIILNLPNSQRTILLQRLVGNMKKDSLPNDFIKAIEALTDEELADNIREVLKI